MRFRHDPSGLLMPDQRLTRATHAHMAERIASRGQPSIGIHQMLIGAGTSLAEELYFNTRSYWDLDDNNATDQFLDKCDGPSAINKDMTARTESATIITSSVSTTSSAKGGLAASFFPNLTDGTTAYVPVANTLVLPNSSWTFGLWVKAQGEDFTSKFLMGNCGALASAPTAQAFLTVDSDNDQYDFKASDGSAFIAINDHVFPDPLSWTLITCTLDRANNQLVIRSQKEADPALQKNFIAFPDPLFTGITTANFCINDALSNDNIYLSGLRAGVIQASCAAYFGVAFTDEHFNVLFNGGAGLSWAGLKTLAGH